MKNLFLIRGTAGCFYKQNIFIMALKVLLFDYQIVPRNTATFGCPHFKETQKNFVYVFLLSTWGVAILHLQVQKVNKDTTSLKSPEIKSSGMPLVPHK